MGMTKDLDLDTLFPELRKMPAVDFIDTVPYNLLQERIQQLSKYYSSQVHLSHVLQRFNITIDPYRTKQYIQCKLPSHYSMDNKPSAQYFTGTVDKETGDWIEQPRVWCYKCNKLIVGSFNYLLEIHRDIRQVMHYYLQEFSIQPPRDLLLAPQQSYSSTQRILEATRPSPRTISKLKTTNRLEWYNQLRENYSQYV